MKKKILFIATGGTIAAEMTDEGLRPGLDPEQLLRYIPETEKKCDIVYMELFNLDSTNIGPGHWLEMARVIRENYDSCDGFVISHGTDTMAYTAAALSYLIQGSPKPIILTGAQKPIGFDTTDSKANLQDSFICACSGEICSVNIVFSSRVIAGTRARKTRSKSFDAFSSINYPHIADIRDGRLLRYITPEHFDRPVFYDKLDSRVGLIKLIPGIERELFEFVIERNDAVIIESFGVGGLPQNGGLHQVVEKAAESGKVIIMTTQVQNEGSDLTVYNIGHSLKNYPGILEAYDMTTEAAAAKIMWILAMTKDTDEIRRMFYTPINMDILSVH